MFYHIFTAQPNVRPLTIFVELFFFSALLKVPKECWLAAEYQKALKQMRTWARNDKEPSTSSHKPRKILISDQRFTCSKSTVEIIEKGIKYIES